jgi:hypothetical protein
MLYATAARSRIRRTKVMYVCVVAECLSHVAFGVESGGKTKNDLEPDSLTGRRTMGPEATHGAKPLEELLGLFEKSRSVMDLTDASVEFSHWWRQLLSMQRSGIARG